jgi:uncharacterized protein YggE
MENEKLCECNKKAFVILGSAFLTIITIFFISKTINEFRSGHLIGQESVIDVSGKGEVFVKPDVTKISVSVEKSAYTVGEAQTQATNAINSVTKFLKDSGIEDKDIKTTSYNIYPQYDYLKDSGRTFRGYTVNQTLEVKLRKIDETGKILAGVTDAGANQVGSVSFVIDDQDSVLREAREKAIKDAKEKAKQLAKDLGVRIIKLVDYSESRNGTYPYPIYSMDSSKAMEMGGESAPIIPTGENSTTVNVVLTYKIR